MKPAETLLTMAAGGGPWEPALRDLAPGIREGTTRYGEIHGDVADLRRGRVIAKAATMRRIRRR